MDDRKLDVFLRAVRSGSLSKAAQEVGCTQSAASQLIGSLEAELGCTLLTRDHKGVSLTEKGRDLLPALMRANEGIASLRSLASSVAMGRPLPLRIGCFSSVVTTWLPEAINSFRERNPEAAFDLVVGTERIAGWLMKGRVDMALGDVECFDEFRTHPLMGDRYLAAIPASYLDEYPWLGDKGTVTLEQLFALPSVMAPVNDYERHFDDHIGRPVHIACDDDSTLIALVERGLGVAVLPELASRGVSPGVRIFDLDPPWTRTLGYALPAEPTRQALEFAAFLDSYVR